MGKKGFGSKRRTVLQLEDEPRKQSTFGLGYKASDGAPAADSSANALSGLMSHYAQESGSDSDSDNEKSPTSAPSFDPVATNHQSKPSLGHLQFQKFVAASDASRPSGVNQPDTSEHAPVQKESALLKAESVNAGPSDDIDLKLQDFLAEIESIEVRKEQSIDDGLDGVPLSTDSVTGQPLSVVEEHVKVAVATTSCPISTVTGSDDEDDFKLSKPREPISKWQQCLDADSQCYYYWHVDTNEVTWEIPAEYSQYLLRFAEYERARAHYDTELADWKAAHPNRKPKTSKKKHHRRHAKKAGDVCIPIVSYPPEEEEEETDGRGPVQGPVCGPPLPLIGPVLPSVPLETSQQSEKRHDTLTAKVSCDLEVNGLPAHSSVNILSSYTSSVSSTSELLTDPGGSKMSVKVKSSGAKSAVRDKPQTPTGTEDEVAVDENLPKRTAKLKDQNEGSSRQSKNIKKLPADREQIVSNVVSETKVLENNLVPPTPATGPSFAAIVDEDDDDDKYAQQMLEESVFVKYEFVNKKYEASDNCELGGSENMEVGIDPDDIDQELERALEQRTSVASMSNELFPLSAEREGAGQKRKVHSDAVDHVPLKKMKTLLESASLPGLLSSQSIQDEVKLKITELAEIAELATTVTDKLSYLEVTCTELSKLQILMLQMETRIEDWRAGALSADRLLTKLRESCATLRQYELSATPRDWSCHWHRTYRRYYYRHEVTGDVCWDFPDTEVALEQGTVSASEKIEATDSFPAEIIESQEDDGREIPAGATMSIVSNSADLIPQYFASSTSTTFPVTESATGYYTDEPPPPGTEPVLPRGLPTELLSSLAACPPPPPPVMPQDEFEVYLDDIDEQENIGSAVQATSAIAGHEVDVPVHSNTSDPGVIRALPILNNKSSTAEVTSSTSTINTPVMSPVATEVADIDGSGDERPDAAKYDSIQTDDVVATQSSSAQTSIQSKDRKKRKEKALVAGGLALKKKNVSSLVEKWQKVQQDVTEEITKEEQKLKIKKQQATNSSGASTGHD